MNHPTTERLNDFADGLLEELEARRVETHLTGCDACRNEVAWLRSLKKDAADWSHGEVAPSRDLWPAIESRIQASERRPARSVGRRREARRPDFRRRARPWVRPSLMTAAAFVLLAVGTGVGLTISRGGLGGPSGGVEMAGNGPSGTQDPSLRFAAAAREVEEAYEPTIQELRRTLEAGRDELAPETVEVLEESLRIIDEALREAREALEADPASSSAMRTLNNMYEAKLQVLRTAAGLTRGA